MKNEEIQNLITEVIKSLNIEVVNISILEDDKGSNTWFSVQVNEPHFFIKQEGEALYALNHVVRRILETNNLKNQTEANSENRKEKSILVDINDFQKKKVDSLRAIAHMMGERARYFKSSVDIDPMSAFERRVIHEFFADATDLKTESLGFGPTRHVIIKYLGEI